MRRLEDSLDREKSRRLFRTGLGWIAKQDKFGLHIRLTLLTVTVWEKQEWLRNVHRHAMRKSKAGTALISADFVMQLAFSDMGQSTQRANWRRCKGIFPVICVHRRMSEA